MTDDLIAYPDTFVTTADLPPSLSMAPNMHAEAFTAEDWSKLADRSSRRRIQNRISQRNRRKSFPLGEIDFWDYIG